MFKENIRERNLSCAGLLGFGLLRAVETATFLSDSFAVLKMVQRHGEGIYGANGNDC